MLQTESGFPQEGSTQRAPSVLRHGLERAWSVTSVQRVSMPSDMSRSPRGQGGVHSRPPPLCGLPALLSLRRSPSPHRVTAPRGEGLPPRGGGGARCCSSRWEFTLQMSSTTLLTRTPPRPNAERNETDKTATHGLQRHEELRELDSALGEAPLQRSAMRC